MKMVRLSLNRIVILILIFTSLILYSQRNVNLIIQINDEIVTTQLGLKFKSSVSSNEYAFSYWPGKGIDINNSIFKEDVTLEFDKYSLNKKKGSKIYNYIIPLKSGLFYDTNYLIIKIYNSESKLYKKSSCKIAVPYLINFQNGRYSSSIMNCIDSSK